MEWVILWIVLCFVAAGIASSKGRGAGGVFFLSLILSPLVGLIVALAMQRREDIDRREAVQYGEAGDFRKCPLCAEAIRREALVCRFCGAAVEPIRPKPGLLEKIGREISDAFRKD